MRFPYCQTADGIAVQVHFCNTLCMFNTDIFISCTLIDTKEHLLFIDGIIQRVQACHFLFAAFQPACGTGYRIFYISTFRRNTNTFIECHSNGRTQIRLNAHAFFGTHKDFSAIYMGAEVNAFFRDFPQCGQGKHLKSAGVSQNGLVPNHKFMKTT